MPLTWTRLHVKLRPVHIGSCAPSQLKTALSWTMDNKKRFCLTCKCPWYILSTQSVADLSVTGSLDFFQTCEAESQTGSIDIKSWGRVFGQEVRRSAQSGAVLLLKCWSWYFGLIQDFSAQVTPRRAGRTFTFPHRMLTLDWDTNHRDLSLHPERCSCPRSLSLLLSVSFASPLSSPPLSAVV